MCVCVCVCLTLGTIMHFYQGFSVEQVIFLHISSCSEPEMDAKQILRENVWCNSNTDAAVLDLSIFVSLPLLLWTALRSSVSSSFY